MSDAEINSLTHQMTLILVEKNARETVNESLRKEIDTIKEKLKIKQSFDLDCLIQESLNAKQKWRQEIKETRQKVSVLYI